jgi:hypothetical protein
MQINAKIPFHTIPKGHILKGAKKKIDYLQVTELQRRRRIADDLTGFPQRPRRLLLTLCGDYLERVTQPSQQKP